MKLTVTKYHNDSILICILNEFVMNLIFTSGILYYSVVIRNRICLQAEKDEFNKKEELSVN